jgi:hypothetical protein
MDKLLRAEIVAEVRRAMVELNERWVTADVLCEHVGTLTKRFLQDHGDMFNRTRVEWTDKEGTRHPQAWLYPLNEIKMWIATGKIKELREISS